MRVHFFQNISWLTTLAIVVGPIILFVLIHALTQPLLKIKEGEEIVGHYIHQVSLIYAILLGLISGACWVNFDRTLRTVGTEQNALMNLYRIGNHLPPSVGEPLKSEIIDYAKTVIHEEWPAMTRGEESLLSSQKAARIKKIQGSFSPETEAESNLQEEALSQAYDFMDARRHRLFQSQEGIPLVLWVVILVGGFLTVAFLFLVYAAHPFRQLAFTVMVTLLISIQWALIIEFSHPYQGIIVIPPFDWERFLHLTAATTSFY
jgi:hypothetical protein